MTPEHLTAASAFIGLLQTLSDGPVNLIPLMVIAVLLFLIAWVSPWVVLYLAQRCQDKRAAQHDLQTVNMVSEIKSAFTKTIKEQEARFESVVVMYENNAELVKGYESLASDLSDIIHLNTQTITNLVQKIDNNMFCPVVRKETGKG